MLLAEIRVELIYTSEEKLLIIAKIFLFKITLKKQKNVTSVE